MKTINVLEIEGKNTLYVPGETYYSSSLRPYINGVQVEDLHIKQGYTFSKDDTLEYMPTTRNLLHYAKGEVKMSVEEYNSKPKYFDEDDEDEVIMAAIENRKLLEGFEAVYDEITLKELQINVVGSVRETNSNFISCCIQKKVSVYTLEVNRITLDEYRLLSIEYMNHGKFEKDDRHYLRFTKVNGKYAFGDHYPFREYGGLQVYTDLEEAQKEEEKIRKAVKKAVTDVVFKEGLTDDKKTNIIHYLKLIKKTKSKVAQDEMIDLLISDLSEYKNNIDL